MEEEIDLRVYVEVLISNWKWIAGLALAAAVAAFAVSSLIPPTYEATALAAVTKPRYVMRFDPRFETVDSVQPVYNAYPELASSDDLVQDLLTSLGSLPEGVETARDLQEIIEARSGADPSMVRLVVSSQEPEEAARIANVWAGLFVTQANEIYGAHNEDQVGFFEGQLKRAQEELDAAEQALIEFQARNQGAVLEAQLASAEQDLQDYLVEKRRIERAVRNAVALQTHIASRSAGEPVTPADELTALLLQVQAFSVQTSRPAQTKGDGAGTSSVVWVPESETGSSIQLQISDAAFLPSGQTTGEMSSSLDDLVVTLEAWGEEMETQVAALEERILTLQQQLQEVRAERNSLTRARDVAQETHTTLAHKVEEARIAAEDTGGEVRLASRAGVPEKPVGPRRLLNTAVAGMLGVMVGVFGAFALEWWRGDAEVGREGDEETRGQGDGETE